MRTTGGSACSIAIGSGGAIEIEGMGGSDRAVGVEKVTEGDCASTEGCCADRAVGSDCTGSGDCPSAAGGACGIEGVGAVGVGTIGITDCVDGACGVSAATGAADSEGITLPTCRLDVCRFTDADGDEASTARFGPAITEVPEAPIVTVPVLLAAGTDKVDEDVEAGADVGIAIVDGVEVFDANAAPGAVDFEESILCACAA